MKNKKHILISFCIPIGMRRSVECINIAKNRHPDRDASLSGCKGDSIFHFLPSDAFPWADRRASLTECRNRNKLFNSRILI